KGRSPHSLITNSPTSSARRGLKFGILTNYGVNRKTKEKLFWKFALKGSNGGSFLNYIISNNSTSHIGRKLKFGIRNPHVIHVKSDQNYFKNLHLRGQTGVIPKLHYFK